jgi:hypothetical protein
MFAKLGISSRAEPIRLPDLDASILAWIVNGAVEVFAALSHRGMQGRGWTIFMGLLSVLAGIVVLVYRRSRWPPW